MYYNLSITFIKPKARCGRLAVIGTCVHKQRISCRLCQRDSWHIKLIEHMLHKHRRPAAFGKRSMRSPLDTGQVACGLLVRRKKPLGLSPCGVSHPTMDSPVKQAGSALVRSAVANQTPAQAIGAPAPAHWSTWRCLAAACNRTPCAAALRRG